MKTIIRIAKLELNILFYSPIAWFLSIVFLFQCGLFYTSTIQTLLTYQEIGGEMLNNLNFLTYRVFGLRDGLFGDVLQKVYLYLPLLTMGLISREISSGTIKLLYTSPVKIKEIIWGKFVAMMVYNLILVLILAVFVGTAMVTIRSADVGLLLSGLLGIYLLLCAYAAIGLFMSCLTSYQVVAAISTLVIFAVLAYIGTVWQGIDFVRDLTYFLSINGRAETIIYGLISTKDVLYFIIIVALFLGFSIIKLQSGREFQSWQRVAGRYITLVVIALVIGYVTSLPGLIGYYDTTADNSQTLTPTTQAVIKELGDEPLEVTSYINLLDQRFGYGQPELRNQDMRRWEPYLRFKPSIKFTYVYYWDEPSADQQLSRYYPGKSLKQIAEQHVKSWKFNMADFKTPGEIRKIIDLRPEENRYVMQLKYKGKTTFLRLFDDQMVFPSESETSAALKRLTVKLPKILFVQGEFERSKSRLSDKEYGVVFSQITNRSAMVNQGFDTDTIQLSKQDIPTDIAALVIADPKIAFTPAALAKIHDYINQGGNLLVAAEPGKQAVINPVLAPLGVQLMEGIVVQKSKDFPPDVVMAQLTKVATSLSPALRFEKPMGVSMPGVAGLRYNTQGPYTIQPLLVTDARLSWLRKDQSIPDSADVVFSAEKGDQKIALPTALALTRKVNGKEQRIMIAGDADFLSSAEVNKWNSANRGLYLPLIGWFTYGKFPIDTSRPGSKDKRLTLTDAGLTTLKVVYLGVLPGIILLVGAVFLIRRKRN